MRRLLVVVDMQKDFVDGVLGTKEAREIVEPLVELVKAEQEKGTEVVFTMDTHSEE